MHLITFGVGQKVESFLGQKIIRDGRKERRKEEKKERRKIRFSAYLAHQRSYLGRGSPLARTPQAERKETLLCSKSPALSHSHDPPLLGERSDIPHVTEEPAQSSYSLFWWGLKATTWLQHQFSPGKHEHLPSFAHTPGGRRSGTSATSVPEHRVSAVAPAGVPRPSPCTLTFSMELMVTPAAQETTM